MNKKLLLNVLLVLSLFKTNAVSTPNLAISMRPAPLCNIMQIVVTLANTEDPVSTYDGPASATITLPVGLTFIRTQEEHTGTVTTAGRVVTWTIPYTVRNPTEKTLTFFASADVPGSYTVTGQAIDDQGVTHIFSTPESIELAFPHINNGAYTIAKNATLVARLRAQLDTTTPATTAVSVLIQPNAQYGTALPGLSEQPFVVTYIPSLDFVGYDFFTAQASDSSTCTDTASIFVAIGVEGNPATSYATFLRDTYNPTPSSQTPVARPITLPTVTINATTTVDLRDYVYLTNATAPFVYTTGGTPAHGTASIINDTVLRYLGISEGNDTFTYTVTDDHGNTSTGTVHVTVTTT
jgi:hypothetical protein